MAAAQPRIDREALRQLNLYEVLQVSAKASPEVVQAAYRVLARVYHPDVNQSPNAARMMRQINAAYKVLSDPERRARYDAQRAHQWRARIVHTERTVRAKVPPDAPRPMYRAGGSRSAAAVFGAAPMRTSWRIGRLVALRLFLMVMMGTLMFAFWIIAGALEEESFGMFHAAASVHRQAL
jgi:DnaJ domain